MVRVARRKRPLTSRARLLIGLIAMARWLALSCSKAASVRTKHASSPMMYNLSLRIAHTNKFVFCIRIDEL
jgi:hypothetical protein